MVVVSISNCTAAVSLHDGGREQLGVGRRGVVAGALLDDPRALPVGLLRNEVLTTLPPMRDEEIEEIVDTIVLPLIRPAETARDERQA